MQRAAIIIYAASKHKVMGGALMELTWQVLKVHPLKPSISDSTSYIHTTQEQFVVACGLINTHPLIYLFQYLFIGFRRKKHAQMKW